MKLLNDHLMYLFSLSRNTKGYAFISAVLFLNIIMCDCIIMRDYVSVKK